MTTARTKTELAALLGCNRATVHGWIARGLIPKDGPWNVEEARSAIDAHKEATAAQPDALRDELYRAQARRIRGRTLATRARRKREEARLAALRDTMPRRDFVRVLVEAAALRIRRNLEAVEIEGLPESARANLGTLPAEIESRILEALT